MTSQGPPFGLGLLLLALAVAPALLLDSQPWHTVAIGNAITHLVTGFSWTMIGTRYTRPMREFGIFAWGLTIFASVALLVVSIFVR